MVEEVIYNYKEDTKEFIGVCPRFVDPLETEVMGETVYMDPPNSTLVEPPVCASGTVPVFDESRNEWIIVEDFRGQIIYNKKTKEGHVVDSLGPIPVGFSTEKPVSLQELKDAKMTELKNIFKEEIDKKFKVNKLLVCVADRPLIDAQLILFDTREENLITVRDEADILTKAEAEEISDVLYNRSIKLYKIREALCEQIICCKNKTQLNGISLNFELTEEKED